MELRGGFVTYTRPVVLGVSFPECFSLYVAEAGNVSVRYGDGSTDTLANLQAGQFYPIRCVTILSAGTTVPAASLRRAY